MAEVKEKAIEKVAEVTAENVHEVADAIPAVARSLTKIRLGFGAIGLTVGAVTAAFATYRIVEKKLREKYAAQAEEEIEQMRDHFRARLVVKEEKPDLVALSKRADDLGYTHAKPVPPAGPGAPVTSATPEVETRNIFEQTQEDRHSPWNYERELAHRKLLDPGIPYVIHEDERHDEDARDYADTTLTWYAGDDILCDDDDRALPNVDELIGLENLERFGDGTDDPDVMFIRNDRLEVIMEVNRSPNSYTEEVHGLKHSEEEPRRRPRFPKWDD